MGVFGVIMMCLFPSVAQWILGAVGVACGVSAVDAWKGAGYDPGCDSDDSDYSNNDDSTGTRSGITGE